MYIFQADVWCDSCGRSMRENLDAKGQENTGDSDDYPQYHSDPGESDSPQHCGGGETCLEADTLPSGRKIGALLTDDLTEDGRKYVAEAARQGGEVAEFWASHFGIDVEDDENEEND